MANKTDYVDLGLACADVCRALDRGMNGKPVDGLSQSVFDAIAQLAKQVLPVMHGIRDALTTLSIAGPLRRSRRRSSRRVGGLYSLGSPMRRTTKR